MRPLLDSTSMIGVLGAGTMGRGIAQLASSQEHKVYLYDVSAESLKTASAHLDRILDRQVEKDVLSLAKSTAIKERISYTQKLADLSHCKLIIEAVPEDLELKRKLFAEIETYVSAPCVLATNTSSLSVASIASACKDPSRVLGMHFFNPAPIMDLVELVPALGTSEESCIVATELLRRWQKVIVRAKDLPGFIVNRIARPFYGESLRILEEGIANVATIDWVMRELGGFRMGPFELMDLIGNDVNFAVTRSVYEAFFFDTRYRPSLTQQRMVEAGRLGRKTQAGYYNYEDQSKNPQAVKDKNLGEQILLRVISMLVNEAADALFLQVATVQDLDLAMTKGVNYPKGLLQWADELGIEKIVQTLSSLREEYGEERYKVSPLLRRMLKSNQKFYGK